jgi:hypothetical protein
MRWVLVSLAGLGCLVSMWVNLTSYNSGGDTNLGLKYALMSNLGLLVSGGILRFWARIHSWADLHECLPVPMPNWGAYALRISAGYSAIAVAVSLVLVGGGLAVENACYGGGCGGPGGIGLAGANPSSNEGGLTLAHHTLRLVSGHLISGYLFFVLAFAYMERIPKWKRKRKRKPKRGMVD